MFVSLLLGEQQMFSNFPWKQDAHEVRLRTFQTFAVPPSEKCEVAKVAFSTSALVLELLGLAAVDSRDGHCCPFCFFPYLPSQVNDGNWILFMNVYEIVYDMIRIHYVHNIS